MATPCNTYTSRPKSQIAQSQHKLAACKYSLQRLVCFQSQNQVGHMAYDQSRKFTHFIPQNFSKFARPRPAVCSHSEHLLVPPSGETNQRLVGFVSRPPSCHGFRASGWETNLKELSYFSTRPPKSIHRSHCGTLPLLLLGSLLHHLEPRRSSGGVSRFRPRRCRRSPRSAQWEVALRLKNCSVDVQSSLRRATSAGGRWMLMLRFHRFLWLGCNTIGSLKCPDDGC